MKYFLLILLFSTSLIHAQEFIRELPEKELLVQLTTSNIPGADAVIIIKEQSISVENGVVNYKGYNFTGLSRHSSFVKIVKLFNEAAVRRYGTFEFSYDERFGDEIPADFVIRARVLKESGKVERVPESDIHKIVSLKNKHNEPLVRKVIMKVSNLAVGDVLQIEHQLNEPFSYSMSGMFFYQDRDPVLFSNVYVTFPPRYTVDVYSYPQDKIGEPETKQISKNFGSGKTYFWSVKNCNSIPDEPFSPPIEDVSYLTGFVVKEMNNIDLTNWTNLIKFYYKEYIDRDNVNSGFFKQIDIPAKVEKVSLGLIDTLYSKIKRNIRVRDYSEIYPERDIMEVIESGQGDATDLSFIMYKMLKKWDVDANVVLIRDKRQGNIETSFPSLQWFDRIGVMVTVDNKERIYDFDASVQNNYELPWHLNGVNLYIVNKTGGSFKKIQAVSSTEQNQILESHFLTIYGSEVKDSLTVTYKGSFAENLRDKFYSFENDKISEHFRTEFLSKSFSDINNCENNDLFENSNVNVSVCGNSICSVEEVDSFLVVNPQEVIFSDLKSKLSSSVRKNHLLFDTPFRYMVEFKIQVPDGYKVKSLPSNSSFTTPFKGAFSFNTENKNNEVRITGVMRMPQSIIESFHYPKVLELIENSVKNMNREIIFQKI